jgi:hypothetical protein
LPEEGLGNRLSFVLDDLKTCLDKLTELETSSLENGRIGIEVIKGSRENLEKLKTSLENQIEKFQKNLPIEQ